MCQKSITFRGVDKINQLVETPASKAQTESRRFIINTAITIVSAVAAIVAAVVAVMVYINP